MMELSSNQQLKKEPFILLYENELDRLVTADNRTSFQPELNTYLRKTQKLKQLRSLSLKSSEHRWSFPEFCINEKGEITDECGNIRGYQHLFALPARPGEPQMALSYDWFWGEFSNYLIQNGIWCRLEETRLSCIARQNPASVVESLWQSFWRKLSSKAHLEQSLMIFLDNKTLFKKQAKPWGSKDIPILSKDMAQFLIDYYRRGKNRKKHFKQGSIPKAIENLESLIDKETFETVPIPVLIERKHYPAGDFNIQSKSAKCAGCGEIISKKEAVERLAIFVKDADERPQSASDKDKRSRYCKRCVATVFLCPLKLAPETLTVRFHSSNSRYSTEMELKKYVAQTLNINSGEYINLHITDTLNRKPLDKVWGAYHFALWKIAVTFPPELFARDFRVEVYPGEEHFSLPRWALWYLSSLAHWDSVFEYNCYRIFNPAFSGFLRLISRNKIFQAFYTLISNKVIHDSYAQSWKMNALQEIWAGLERIQMEESYMPIPDYPKIVGYAGLLLPLAERVQYSKEKDAEKKRALTKLLEEVDKPIQYAYTAARESNSPDFIFCRNSRNRFFYEKALELLQWAGEDVADLQRKATEKADELAAKDEKLKWMQTAESKIFIGPDQIARVASALTNENEKPYANEAKWRDFAYQVKLALWSFFPRHLGSQDK